MHKVATSTLHFAEALRLLLLLSLSLTLSIHFDIKHRCDSIPFHSIQYAATQAPAHLHTHEMTSCSIIVFVLAFSFVSLFIAHLIGLCNDNNNRSKQWVKCVQICFILIKNKITQALKCDKSVRTRRCVALMWEASCSRLVFFKANQAQRIDGVDRKIYFATSVGSMLKSAST